VDATEQLMFTQAQDLCRHGTQHFIPVHVKSNHAVKVCVVKPWLAPQDERHPFVKIMVAENALNQKKSRSQLLLLRGVNVGADKQWLHPCFNRLPKVHLVKIDAEYNEGFLKQRAEAFFRVALRGQLLDQGCHGKHTTLEFAQKQIVQVLQVDHLPIVETDIGQQLRGDVAGPSSRCDDTRWESEADPLVLYGHTCALEEQAPQTANRHVSWKLHFQLSAER
jgi:hypothetical protein